MTIWTKQSPPTTLPDSAGLDAPGWSGPVPRPGLLAGLRRFAGRNAFKLTVLRPAPRH